MGTVYLVGIGPGHPPDLTLRAVEVLSRAGALLLPANIPEEITAYAPAGVERIAESFPPENARRLAGLVERHTTVCRIYDGHPLEMNPGALEGMLLAAEGVEVEIVSGLSDFVSAASGAGVPVAGEMGRGGVYLLRSPLHAGSLETAERVLGNGEAVVLVGDAEELAKGCVALDRGGAHGATTCTFVRRGGSAGQTTWSGTLADAARGLPPGSGVLFLGATGAPHPGLQGFERRPLFGRSIVVTRPRAQAAGFVSALEEQGARVVAAPMIRIIEPTRSEPLVEAARRVGSYDWVVFTSANGVERFWAALREAGLDTRALGGVSICAIGPATAGAVEREGAGVDLQPDQFVAESIVAAFRERGLPAGGRVLLPRAEIARAVLPESIREMGVEVDEVVAYRTVADAPSVEELRVAVDGGTIDVITFTSSSTVRTYADLVGPSPPRAVIASIGPITSGTARELGWEVKIEAREHTTAGLTAAIVDYYRRPRRD